MSGVLAIVVNVTGVISVQYWGYWEAVPGSLWKHLDALPVFDVAAVATMLSMLLPPAYFGASLLMERDEPPTFERLWDGNNGGQPAELLIFFLTSCVVMPLVVIFPFDPSDEFVRGQIAPSRFSASNYVGSYVLIWWAHGAVNAYHVHRLRLRTRDASGRVSHAG